MIDIDSIIETAPPGSFAQIIASTARMKGARATMDDKEKFIQETIEAK